ncbi:MAG: hypothetical protein Kow0089_13980 [Desulfobulbaceae bacterium]
MRGETLKPGDPAMRCITVPLLFFLLLGIPAAGTATDAKAPSEINGFRLGASIEEYDFINYRNYLKEVMINDIGGFRRGTISYGTCARPGEIVRIKLKYKDNSHDFYKELLKRFKKKFGKPDEFTGDAFGIVLSWKWRFKDREGNDVTLTLQHNRKNLNETMGNMVKLSMPGRIEEERKCFLKTCESVQTTCPVSMMSEDWDNLIPK